MKKNTALLLLTICLLASCNSALKNKFNFNTTEKPIPKSEVKISVLHTGKTVNRSSFIYESGKFSEKKTLTFSAILIQHPEGSFLFDTGIGDSTEALLKKHVSYLKRKTIKFESGESVKTQFQNHNFKLEQIDFIIPSHFHYDHTGGIEDFKNAKTWILEAEDSIIKKQKKVLPFFKPHFDNQVNWNVFTLDPTPYFNFETSNDIFNDGSLILVSLPGHTPGSLGLIAHLKSGKSYFFVGDLIWVNQALSGPNEKHCIPRSIVDFDDEIIKKTIFQIKKFQELMPSIIIVPAHDYEIQSKMAEFPLFE
jgi:glyoxylase-like metal-dependent hydrolase (beta-lactamase superfamily II)